MKNTLLLTVNTLFLITYLHYYKNKVFLIVIILIDIVVIVNSIKKIRKLKKEDNYDIRWEKRGSWKKKNRR